MYHSNKVAGQKFAEISIELQWKITVGPKQICKKESSFYSLIQIKISKN